MSTWLDVLKIVVPVVMAVLLAALRVEIALARQKKDIEQIRDRAVNAFSRREQAAFERLQDERHSRLAEDVREAKEALTRDAADRRETEAKLFRRVERLTLAMARVGDLLNGKRRKPISEDTES